MSYYSYSIERNKGLPISQTKLRRELLKEKKFICYLCKKDFSERKSCLELEHKIPVMIGGKIIDKDNLDIACLNCHREKTIADKKIIHSLKIMGIINGIRDMKSLLNFEELEEYYNKYFPLCLSEVKRDPWGEDPDYIKITKNREVEDGKDNL